MTDVTTDNEIDANLHFVKYTANDFFVYAPAAAKDQWPGVDYARFPDNFCGAGNGIGEKLVPDYLGFWWWKVKVSPACWAHDMSWDYCEPTWEAFHSSNSHFLDNLIQLIDSKCNSNAFIKAMLKYGCMTFYNAVNTAGRNIFWTQMAIKSCIIPDTAKEFVNWSDHDISLGTKMRNNVTCDHQFHN